MQRGRKTAGLLLAVVAVGLSAAPTDGQATGPSLNFVTQLGSYATVYAIASDDNGNTYVGGTTALFEFTTTPGAFQTVTPGGTGGAFVAKIDPSGALVYSTFLSGSSGADVVYGIAVDSQGDAYVTGSAVSTDFPTLNAFQPTCVAYQVNGLSRCADAFVAELNPSGGALVYSSYLGGTPVQGLGNVGQSNPGAAIAVDASGAAYVTGSTHSSDFPMVNAFQPLTGGGTCGTSTQPFPCADAFVAKIAPGGSSLVYSTFLGGSNTDDGYGISVDTAGDVYVAGGTGSFDFPILNAIQSSCVPFAGFPSICVNAFVTELDSNGSALVFSTYLGGAANSTAQAVSLDSSGNIYVTGYTNAKDFPTVNAFQPSNASTYDPPDNAFVTEFAADGQSLVYSTYLGGSTLDFGYGIAVDAFGEAFVTGIDQSADFPVLNAIQSTNQGALQDAFVTGFQAGGQGLIYSTYLGGPAGSNTRAWGIAVNSQGDAWVGGDSDASTFPAAANRSQIVRHYGARRQAAVTNSTTPAAMAAAISLDAARVDAAPASLVFGDQLAGGTTASQTVTVSNPGTASLQFSEIAASSNFSVASGGTCATSGSVAPNSNCTVNVAFAPTVGGNLTGTLTLTDNGIGTPHKVALSGTGQDFAVSSGQTSATVAPGGTASYSLSFAPQGGLAATVTLACTGAPAKSTCTVNPSSVTLDGTHNATATVNLTTTAPSATFPLRAIPFSAPPVALWIALFAFAGAALLVRLRKQQTRIREVAVWGVLVVAASMAVSCGGGASVHVPSGGTPAGTYNLTLTATSGSLAHSTTLTLTVR